MEQFILDDNSEHKKAKDVGKNIALKISHYEYKGVLLNNKCLKHSKIKFKNRINRIQNKNLIIRSYEINIIYLSCFHLHLLLNNRHDGLALGC